MSSLLERTDAPHQQEEERKFKCSECGRGYRHAGSLTNHKRTHEVGSFQCTICGKENWNVSAMKNHLRSHTSFRRYSCPDCGKCFRLAAQLHTHERVHLASKEHSWRNTNMENSTQDNESDQQPQVNEHANSLGISAENLPEDVSVSPPEGCDDAVNRPFRCNLCEKSYIHHRSLINHKKTHQLGMFECTVCFKLCSNMGALYSHQRTHKARGERDLGLTAGPPKNTTLDPFPLQDQDDPGNFCHLCQVLFPSNVEFQDHIQMHNSSSQSFPHQADIYLPSRASPGSSFCVSPVDNLPPLSLTDHPSGSDQKAPHSEPQSDASVTKQKTDAATETEGTDSDERPFKCHTCGKSYRHSGSLINHKRSHQVGVFQCSVCNKKYPHLAALKSHLRLHKAARSSLQLHADQDWQPDEQRQPSFGGGQENMADGSSGAFNEERSDQNLSRDMAAHLPPHENAAPRHMCADCGETSADIAGIKSHICPLLQPQHGPADVDLGDSLNFNTSSDQRASENPEMNLEFPGLDDNLSQNYFEQSSRENVSAALLNGVKEDEDPEDDGDHYQCSVCGNGYTSMTALRIHLHGHTQSHDAPRGSAPPSLSSGEEAGELMICSACGETFVNRQDLIAHHLLHQEGEAASLETFPTRGDVSGIKEEASLICSSCGVSCGSYDDLNSHGCTAGQEDESACRQEEIKAEVRPQHQEAGPGRETAGDRRHKCDQCGRSYRHAGSLLNHKKSHKTGVFRCVICQKRFYNLLALKNHQRSHFDIKRHTCQECGKAFKIQKQLLNHLRRHKENQAKIRELLQSDGRTPPSASDAAQVLSVQRAAEPNPETSVKSEDGGDKRPFSCNQCGRTYRHAGSLVNHRNSHKTGQYYCSICKNTYSNQLAMKNHLRSHLAYKKHSCQRCGKGFRGRKQLLAHVCAELRKKAAAGRAGLRSRTFRCVKCRKAFPSADHLMAHACDETPGRGTGEEERPFTCNVCHRTYRHAGSLLNHKNSHKTGHYSCTFCSKPFTNLMALRNHTRIHTQKKKHACLTCGKAFRLASVLQNHQRVHSRAQSPFSRPKKLRGLRGPGSAAASGVQQSERRDRCFVCDLCGRSYRHAGSLLNHKKTHSENLYQCSLCLQTFPDLLSLQSHSQIRRQGCAECGKTFCVAAHLQSHMQVHSKKQDVVCSPASYQQHRSPNPAAQPGADGAGRTGPPTSDSSPHPQTEEKSHVCEHCGRTYRHAGSLLNHKNSHKTGCFFCSVCQKEFTNLMALKNHQRIHTEPKRYQCPTCGKAFRVSTQLICHRRIHTKERPFCCQLCSRSFSSKSNLRHHQKMHQNATQSYSSSFGVDGDAFTDLESFL